MSYPGPAMSIQNLVTETLRTSGAFIPNSGEGSPGAPATITVVGNDIGDTGTAFAKGFKTGLTFGAAGSVVNDNYEFTFDYRKGSQSYHGVYRHTIYTTVGNAQPPVSSMPTTLTDAIHQVVQDVTLNFVNDLQQKGMLAQ